MTDRELLEAAAKAAGVQTVEDAIGPYLLRPGCVFEPWNPLTDDGDALRLAVKLALIVDTHTEDNNPDVTIIGVSAHHTMASFVFEPDNGDAYAATRRAIVRAAAAIGGTRATDGSPEGRDAKRLDAEGTTAGSPQAARPEESAGGVAVQEQGER